MTRAKAGIIGVGTGAKQSALSLDKISTSLRAMRGPLLAVTAAITGLGVLTVKAASDMEESVNAVNVVFGDAADQILRFGENAANTVGLSNAAFNQMSTQTGALLKDVGISITETADLTTQLTVRAADMASVFNTDVKDAMSAINQALRGETEAIRRYAGDVTDATLETFALSQGINKSATEMSQQEKRLLRVGLIMQQTAVTAGDFANTSDSLANRLRIARAQLTDVAAELGTQLLPIATRAVQVLSDLVKWFGDLSSPVKTTILVIAGATAAFAALLVIIPPVISAIRGITIATALMKGAMGGPTGVAVTLAAMGAAAIGTSLIFQKAMKETSDSVKTASDSIVTSVDKVKKATHEELVEAYQAAIDKSTELSQRINEQSGNFDVLVRATGIGTKAFNELKREQEQAETQVQSLGRALGESERALQAVADAAGDTGKEIKSLVALEESLKGIIDDVTESMEKGAKSMQAWGELFVENANRNREIKTTTRLMNEELAQLVNFLAASGFQTKLLTDGTLSLEKSLALARDMLANWNETLAESGSTGDLGREAIANLNQLGAAISKALTNRYKEARDAAVGSLQDQIEAVRESESQALDALQKRVDESRRLHREMTDSVRQSYRDQIRANDDRHRAIMDSLAREMDSQLALIDLQTQQQLGPLMDRLKAIDAEAAARAKQERDAQNSLKLLDLTNTLQLAEISGNNDAIADSAKALTDFQHKLNMEKIKDALDAEKAVLNAQIDGIKDSAKAAQDQIRDDLTAKRNAARESQRILEQSLRDELDQVLRNLDDRQDAQQRQLRASQDLLRQNTALTLKGLDDQLEAAREHYAKLLDADSIQAETRKMILANNQQEMLALLMSYNPLWQDAGQSLGESLVNGLNSQKQSMADALSAMLGGGAGGGATGAGATGGTTPGGAGGFDTTSALRTLSNSLGSNPFVFIPPKMDAAEAQRIIALQQELNPDFQAQKMGFASSDLNFLRSKVLEGVDIESLTNEQFRALVGTADAIQRQIMDATKAADRMLSSFNNKYEADAIRIAQAVLGLTDPSSLSPTLQLAAFGGPEGLSGTFTRDYLNQFLGGGFAHGVRNFRGGVAMVGEQGRELVNLPQGSNVYSNPETRAMLQGGSRGGVTLNYNQNAPVYGFLDFQDQVAEAWKKVKESDGFRGLT
jgi:hypothetical protein